MNIGLRFTRLLRKCDVFVTCGFLRLAAATLFIGIAQGCVLLNPTNPYTGMPQRAGSEHKPVSRPTIPLRNEPITLSKAITIALANNPELAAVRYRVDVASAERDVAFGAILPKAGVRSGYDYYLDRHRIGAPRFKGESRTYSDGIFSTHVVVSMPLYAGGRLISEIQAAKLLQEAAEHRLARNRDELVFNVSSVFYSILAQHHVINSLEFSQQTLKEHRKRISELIQAKKAAKVDYLRTEVRIADLERQLVWERNILTIQKRVLSNLLGVEHEEGVPVDVAGELTIERTTVIDVETGITRAMAQRGDYLAMREALEAQAKRVDIARAMHLPMLTLQGTYGGLRAVGRVERYDDSSYDDVGRVGLALEFPIFEGGRISARVRQERSKLAEAREQMRKLELQLRLDVETAVLNSSSSLERVEATETSIEQAKESLRIEREKYDYGKGTITDVLDAQSALLDSQMSYYRALADYKTALAQLQLAVGEK